MGIFEQLPELSPDVEWMLQSGQASREMLAEALVAEYYEPVWRLGLSLFEDSAAAGQFALETLSTALLEVHRYAGQVSAQVWILRKALAVSKKTRWQQARPVLDPYRSGEHKNLPGAGNHEYFQRKDALHQIRDLLSDDCCTAICLHYLLGIEAAEIAVIFKTDRDKIRRWIETADQIYRSCLWPSGQKPEEESVRLSAWLQDQHPQPALSESIQREIRSGILQMTEILERQQRLLHHFKELLVVSIVVLVIGGIMLGVWRLNPDRPFSQANMATEVFLQVERPKKDFYSYNSETTKERATSPEPLDIMSSPESVQERISRASLHWSTLWQDVSLIFYGPPGYVGPPDTIRAQIWLRQPNETKMIAGPVGGRPDYQFLGRDKGFHQATVDSLLRWYYLAFDRHLALGTNIGSLATPVSSLERGQGRLVVQGIEVVAGHPALVVDQLNNKGKLESRIWVDTVTGVTLRKRLFAPSDPDIVLVEAVTNSIYYDEEFPAGLFEPGADTDGTLFARNYLGTRRKGDLVQSRDHLAYPITFWAPRPYRDPIPAFTLPPASFVPSRSELAFQYIPALTSGMLQFNFSNMDAYADLFAADFYLGSIKTGDPFTTICDRSPDGMRLAFAQGRQSQPRQVSNLSWVNLEDPKRVNSVELALDLSHFAFAPDSQRLALFGFGDPLGSLYLLDTDSGELHKLLNLEYVRGLMWSPDGEYLAIIGNWESPEYNEELMIIDAGSGAVISYFDPYGFSRGTEPSNLPEWIQGKTMPESTGGLEACAAPPNVYTASSDKETPAHFHEARVAR
jgi:DNA-directed RNA polymerase specialized sigma24 family protein